MTSAWSAPKSGVSCRRSPRRSNLPRADLSRIRALPWVTSAATHAPGAPDCRQSAPNRPAPQKSSVTAPSGTPRRHPPDRRPFPRSPPPPPPLSRFDPPVRVAFRIGQPHWTRPVHGNPLGPLQLRQLCRPAIGRKPASARPGDVHKSPRLQIQTEHLVSLPHRKPKVPIPVKIDGARSLTVKPQLVRQVQRGFPRRVAVVRKPLLPRARHGLQGPLRKTGGSP